MTGRALAAGALAAPDGGIRFVVWSRPPMGHWRRAVRGVLVPLLAVACLLGATGARRTPALEPGLPMLTVDDAASREGDAGQTALVFTLRLSEAAADTVWVSFETRDGTASVADADYEPASGRLAFPPGSLAESLAVQVRGDTVPEDDEWFVLPLSDAVGAAFADSEAVGVLLNDDAPLLTLEGGSVAEGDSGTRAIVFHLRLASPTVDTVTVELVTQDSTATAGEDYEPFTGPLVLAPGSLADSLAILVLGDTLVEGDEAFRLRIVGLSGAFVTDSLAVGEIRDDDLPMLSVADSATLEGDRDRHALAFRVRLGAPAVAPVHFHWETVDGTARADDADYLATGGDTLIGPGEDQVLLAVEVVGDTLLEGNERFSLRLTAIDGARPGRTTAVGTVANDERTTFERFAVAVPDFRPGTLPPAWGDLQEDERPDTPLYLNTGDGFIEMPGLRALLGDGNYHGVAWCDFDRDGDMDLVVLPYGGSENAFNRLHLFEATPDGFQDAAPGLGMDVVGFGETAVWGDFDADGWPDLFAPFYSHVEPFRSFLWRNLGDGSFEERADSAGVDLPDLPFALRPEGAAAADWNGDGALDLYCASHLFVNDGAGRFTDVRAQAGLPVVFDEGAQFVDFDDDGDLDLYLRTAMGPTLFRNSNDVFSDVSATLGLGALELAWGDRWADLDGDGDLDLVYFRKAASPGLLLNQGDGTFEPDTAFQSLFSPISLSAVADFDGDGDLDLIVGDYGRQFASNRLERIACARTSRLRVRVEDAEGRLTAYGATVRLRSLDDPLHPVQTRIVDGGSGYLAQDEYEITFGGLGSGAYDLEVAYPSRPGEARVVGPAQNLLLRAIRPGEAGPRIFSIRPNGSVTVQDLSPPTAGVATLGPTGALAFRIAPNPVRSLARFALSLPVAVRVRLDVHDVSGRVVRTLERAADAPGPMELTWDLCDRQGRPVPAGLYFARLVTTAGRSRSQRIVVLR